ncbi:hypothetical protein Zmor_011825 [Zophobas morio]|uniref:Uncharacterized protein n=1 Tax=Zophobas morio TaxID=2755281 RepID=A0AA38M0A8_9CUCU|nr:hypothetical protein Zmor_011825 [Zophobas morio]
MKNLADRLGISIDDNNVKSMLRYQTPEQAEAMRKAQEVVNPKTKKELDDAAADLKKAKQAYTKELQKMKASMNNVKESDELINARAELDSLIKESKEVTDARVKNTQAAISTIDPHFVTKDVSDIYDDAAYAFEYS